MTASTANTASLEALRRCHFAVDLGAARTRVYVKGAGLVVDQPSAAAVNTRTARSSRSATSRRR